MLIIGWPGQGAAADLQPIIIESKEPGRIDLWPQALFQSTLEIPDTAEVLKQILAGEQTLDGPLSKLNPNHGFTDHYDVIEEFGLNRQAVLVTAQYDDRDLVHQVWQLAADSRSVKLRCFTSIPEFVAEADSIDPASTIYVDSHLGNSVKGEVASKELYDRGFKNIILTTGYQAEDFASYSHLRKIIDKTPPFGNN